jgi:hypothetical protein
LGERCLADPGNIFNQEVAAREQASDRKLHGCGFPDNDFANLFCECINQLPHNETIRRIDAIRKLRQDELNEPSVKRAAVSNLIGIVSALPYRDMLIYFARRLRPATLVAFSFPGLFLSSTVKGSS